MSRSKRDPLRLTALARYRLAWQSTLERDAQRRELGRASDQADRRVLEKWIEALDADRQLLLSWRRQPERARPAEEEVRQAVRGFLREANEAMANHERWARFQGRRQRREAERIENRVRAMGDVLHEAAADPRADADSLNRWMSRLAHHAQAAKAYNTLVGLYQLRGLREAQMRMDLAASLVDRFLAGDPRTPDEEQRFETDRRRLAVLIAEQSVDPRIDPARHDWDWATARTMRMLEGSELLAQSLRSEEFAASDERLAREALYAELTRAGQAIRTRIDKGLEVLSSTGFWAAGETPILGDEGRNPEDPPTTSRDDPAGPQPDDPLGSGGKTARPEATPDSPQDQVSPGPDALPDQDGSAGTPDQAGLHSPDVERAPGSPRRRHRAREGDRLPKPGDELGDEGRVRPARPGAPGQDPAPPSSDPPKPANGPGAGPQAEPGRRRPPRPPGNDR